MVPCHIWLSGLLCDAILIYLKSPTTLLAASAQQQLPARREPRYHKQFAVHSPVATHIPTMVGRFSLDETFDVGEDMGTAVVEDYGGQNAFWVQRHRLPYRFTEHGLT